MRSSGSGIDEEAEGQMRRGMAEEERARGRGLSIAGGGPNSLPPRIGSYNSDDEMPPPVAIPLEDAPLLATGGFEIENPNETTWIPARDYAGYSGQNAVVASAARMDAAEAAINGLGVGVAQAELSAINGTISTVKTLAGAGLDLIARPLGIDAYASHTDALRMGLGDFADFLGNEPLGQIARAAGNYVDATRSAYQSGDNFEAFRLGGRGLGEAALLGVGAIGNVGRAGRVGAVADDLVSPGDLARLNPKGPGNFTLVSEGMKPRAAAYQSQITGLPHEVGYVVDGVKFDGYTSGALLDAKGLGYANFVRGGEFQPYFGGADDLVSQAQRQLSVAGNAPVHWHFAEQPALTATRSLFERNGITGVEFFFTPFEY